MRSTNRYIILNKNKSLNYFKFLLNNKQLDFLKNEIHNFEKVIENPKSDKEGLLNIVLNGETVKIPYYYITNELNQILDSRTLERAKYYIKRLIKGLSETRTSRINDINLNRWKEYNDIITDSLWILKKRDNSGVHSAEYWGNFIPQIPNQFLRRYTKKGEWVLDPFLGCGTTLIECQRLGRNGIGVELQRKISELAKKNIEKERDLFNKNVETIVINDDSTEIDFRREIEKIGIKSVHFLIMHPPYWDIIKFSDDERDLSNAKTIDEFLKFFGRVVDRTYSILEKGRYFALVVGDKYSRGEWIPLGFYTMQEVLKRGYILKSTIIKNFEETKGKKNQKELWRYRALVGGFYIFKHEYIFLFKKVK